jgi:hypothetical protein
MMTFTAEQLADFKSFRFVQDSGACNMLDPEARIATGMDATRYKFVLSNYAELKKIADAMKVIVKGK